MLFRVKSKNTDIGVPPRNNLDVAYSLDNDSDNEESLYEAGREKSSLPPSESAVLGELDISDKPLAAPSWKVLLTTIVVVWAIGFFVQAIGGLLWISYGLLTGDYLADGLDREDITSVLSTLPVGLMVVMMFIDWCAAMVICVFVMKRKYRWSIAKTLGIKPVPLHAFRDGLIASFIGFALMALAAPFVGEVEDAPINEVMFVNDENGDPVGIAFPMIIAAVFIAPIAEEMYYRGFLFPAFRGLIGTRGAFIVVVLWFTAVHGYQNAGNIFALSVIMSMGAMWTWFRYKYDSILPGMFSHFAYNGTLMLISTLAIRGG